MVGDVGGDSNSADDVNVVLEMVDDDERRSGDGVLDIT